MTTEDLIIYINSQLAKNITKEIITSKLISKGWRLEDIEEGFEKVNSTKNESVISNTNLSKDNLIEEKNYIVKKTEVSISSDTNIEKNLELRPLEIPKVWTPTSIKPKIDQSIPNEIKKEEVVLTPTASTNPLATPKENSILIKNEELLPSLKPKDLKNLSDSYEQANIGFNTGSTFIPTNEYTQPKIEKNEQSPSLDLPKSAIISSYTQDLSSFNGSIREDLPKNNHKFYKWAIVVFVISVVLGGLFYSINKNYIKIPSINFSFIKKDPRVLFLESQNKIDNVDFYKIDNEINISFPSFSDITNSLVSGENAESFDRDFINFKTRGKVSNIESQSLSENTIYVNGSFFDEDILANIKSNSSDLFINIKDSSDVLIKNSSPSSLVVVPKNQIDLYINEFPNSLKEKIKIFNLSKFVKNTSFNSSYDISSEISDYINEAQFTAKEDDDINGISTYHYSINASKQDNKKFITKTISMFLVENISQEDSNEIVELLGSVNIDSFEFWVGKKDNIIYQYKLDLSVPLSKIIGFEDRGLSGSDIKISVKRTYYDFDSVNEISISSDAMPLDSFIKSVHQANLKEVIYSMVGVSKNLFNIEGGYGKQSNNNGSCMSPISGSLFSPIGHSKGSESFVAEISKIMNSVLETTKGVGSCYSTSKDWALSVPLLDDYNQLTPDNGQPQTYFCVDNTGAQQVLNKQITSSVCK